MSPDAGTSKRPLGAVGCQEAANKGSSSGGTVDCSAGPVPERIAAKLKEAGLQQAYRMLSHLSLHRAAIATAADASAALGIPASQVAKSIALLAGDQPWVAVIRGDHKLDFHRVSAVVDVPRRKIKIAAPDVCMSTFGYAPGTLPPFGHTQDIPVLLDCGLAAQEQPTCCVATDGGSCTPAGTRHHSAGQQGQQGHLAGQDNTEPPTHDTNQVEAQSTAVACCVPGSEQNHYADDDAAPRLSGSGQELSSGQLYCGAGTPDAIISLSFDQLVAVSGATVATISKQEYQPASSPTDEAEAASALATDTHQTSLQLEQQAGGIGMAGGLKFLLDNMLGRLCRWLRCLGVDAELVSQHTSRQHMIDLIANAATQGRVVLTRDFKLVARRDCGAAFLLQNDDPVSQLQEVSKHFGITLVQEQLMTRCSVCNAADLRSISREDAQERVSRRVYRIVEEFFECGNCHKVFWVGPKSHAAAQLMESVLQQIQSSFA
uniref:Mut7-C RNAse domain-containing protein n=1 Tax=Chlamydomonas chlamydogama TaxID=225041 RepID=A0A7S2VVD9_9CHLO